MTTLASDGRTVAGDGLETSGNEPVRFDVQKLFRGHNGEVLGFLGASAFRQPVLDWYRAGCNPESMPKADDGSHYAWTFAVFKPEHALLYRCDCPYPSTFPYPAAFGSGENYALGALFADATPERAVHIAARLNVKTGGTIAVMSIIPGTATVAEAAE